MAEPHPDDAAAFRAGLRDFRQHLAALEQALGDLLALIEAKGETPETTSLRAQLETGLALMHAVDDIEPPAR